MFYNSSPSRMVIASCIFLFLLFNHNYHVHAFSGVMTNATTTTTTTTTTAADASPLSIGTNDIITAATAGALQWSYTTGGDVRMQINKYNEAYY